MLVFETNSGLGYQEVAYFIETNEKKLLCIYENQDADIFWKSYTAGKIEEGILPQEVQEVIPEKHQMVLDGSPLAGTFLFDEFLRNIKDI